MPVSAFALYESASAIFALYLVPCVSKLVTRLRPT